MTAVTFTLCLERRCIEFDKFDKELYVRSRNNQSLFTNVLMPRVMEDIYFDTLRFRNFVEEAFCFGWVN